MSVRRAMRRAGSIVVTAIAMRMTATLLGADLDANTELNSATVDIPLEGGTQNVTQKATSGAWTGYWDFGDKSGDGVRNDPVSPLGLDMGAYYLRHIAGTASPGSIDLKFNLNGGDLISAGGYLSTDAGRNVGAIWLHDVRDLLMGNGYISVWDTPTGYTTSAIGDIRIGQTTLRARNVQVAGLRRSRYGLGTGGVFIYGTGYVLIQDGDGAAMDITIGETTTTPPTTGTGEAVWSRLEVFHQGAFRARNIYGILNGYQGTESSNAKALQFDGWYLGAGAPTGSFHASRIDTEAIIRTGTTKVFNAPSIVIRNYDSVTIGDVVTDAWDGGGSGNNTGTAGSLFITNIVGNIALTDSVSLNAESAGSDKDGVLVLQAGGTIVLGSLDMARVKYALIDGAAGSHQIVTLANFGTANDGGSGTAAAPYETTQTAFRMPVTQTNFYSLADGLNLYLGGYAYRVADESGAAGAGGVLMHEEDVPIVTTEAPSDIHTNRAALNGTLLREGASAPTVSVYWGPEDKGAAPAGWAHTNTFPVHAGGVPAAYATNITTLAPGTEYFYRYYAVNDEGEMWGAAASFVSWQPPAATASAPTELLPRAALLQGAVTAGVPAPDAYFCVNPAVDGGTGSTGNWWRVIAMGVQTSAFAARIAELDAGSTYYVRVYVKNNWTDGWSAVVNFTTPASPAQLTLDADYKIDGTTPAIGFVETAAELVRATAASPWLYDFSWMSESTIDVDFDTYELFCDANDGVQETIVLDLNGGDLAGSADLALRTYIGSDGTGKNADDLILQNVGNIAIGGIDTHANNGSTYATPLADGGNITIGAVDKRAGLIRVGYLYSHCGAGGTGDVAGNGTPGDIVIHGSGNVLVQNEDGTVRGDILTLSPRRENAGDVTIRHNGAFIVDDILTESFSGQTSSGYGGDVLIVGDDVGGVPVGAFAADSISTAYTRDQSDYGTRAGIISIAGYTSVEVNSLRACYLGQVGGYGGNITITNIAGDIAIQGAIDAECRRRTTDKTHDGILGLYTRAGSGGSIQLAELDLTLVRYAALNSDSKTSTITGEIANFDTTFTGGNGSVASPYVTTQVDLRANAGERVYYTYKPGEMNDYLGGAVYYLRNLANTGTGGLLMPVGASGTLFIVR